MRTCRLSFCIVAVAALAAAGPHDALQLANPSFEELDPETGLPTGWHSNTKAVIVSDDTVASEGERSLAVIFFGSMQDLFYYASFTPPTPDPTAVYRVTVDVRMQDYEGRIGLQSYRYPAPFKQKFETDIDVGGESTAWRSISLDIPAKPDMTSVTVTLFARGTWGRLWVDHVRVRRVGE